MHIGCHFTTTLHLGVPTFGAALRPGKSGMQAWQGLLLALEGACARCPSWAP